MKKYFIIIFLILISTFSFSQKIKVKSNREDIGGSKHDVLVVTIYQADENTIEKAWKSLMKGYGAKVSTGSEIVSKNATIKDITEKPIDVYAKIKKNSDGFTLIVGFDLGGAFLSESLHSDKYKYAEKIVSDFANDVTKEAFENLIKDQTKILEGLQRKQEKLVKENEGLHSDIEKYKKRIQDAEYDIKKNMSNQDNMKSDIEKQKSVVGEIEAKKKKAGF